MRMFVQAVVLGAAFGLALPAAAQTAPAPAATGKPAKKPLDPDQVICEKQEVVGSRLAANRVCMTRAQWAEQRRADHDLVERSQSQQCNTGNGCGSH